MTSGSQVMWGFSLGLGQVRYALKERLWFSLKFRKSCKM